MRSHSLGIFGALGCLALLGAASPAEAAVVFKNVAATPTVRVPRTVAAGATITVETRNLSANTDSYIHLWDVNGRRELARNDDGNAGFGHGTFASRLTWTNNTGAAVAVQIIARAYSASTAGTADLYVDGALSRAAATMAGNRIGVTGALNRYEYQTAGVPNGIKDTYLYALDANQKLVAIDDDSGVGNMSRYNASGSGAAISYVILSPYSGPAGNASLYVNDPAQDADADGLGTELEAALATCDAKVGGCSGVFNTQDTDRDGLSDYEEVLGRFHSSRDQALPQWGADPRHKDIFVEMDYRADLGVTSSPFRAQDALDIRSRFSVASANDVSNPDGLPGINVHLDMGIAPANAADAALYGDWGGASLVPNNFNQYSAGDDPVHFDVSRRGVFHYALMYLNAGGGGQADAAGTRLGWGGTSTWANVVDMVHELGHNLNLSHSGHPSWGDVNCKPHYASMMNYAELSEFFSTGQNTAALNPSSLNELAGVGATPPSYFPGWPYFFPTSGSMVDWNRDGTYSSVFVRSGITWARHKGCDALVQNGSHLSSREPASTPSLIRRGRRLYVFYAHDNKIFYRHGALTAGVENGSCPNGQQIGTECTTWSPEQQVPTAFPALSTSAAVWTDDNAVMLAYRRNDDGIVLKRALSADAAGNLASWTSDNLITVSGTGEVLRTNAEPELKLLTGRASHLGAGTVMALLFKRADNSQYHWVTSTGPLDQLTYRGALLDVGGATLAGSTSPTLASMPGGSGLNYQTCGAFPNFGGFVNIYCYDEVFNRWLLRSRAFESPAFGNTAPTTKAKPGFAFHYLRAPSGNMLTNPARGQFYLTIQDPRDNRGRLSVSDPIDAVGDKSNVKFVLESESWDQWKALISGTGMAMYEDASVGAMKHVSLYPGWGILFTAFFDGSFSATLKDGNDFHVMERGICKSIRGDAYCGGPTTSKWGY